MKKRIFIAVCLVGVFAFSSCRSTSQHCGLANNTQKAPSLNNQQEITITTTVAVK